MRKRPICYGWKKKTGSGGVVPLPEVSAETEAGDVNIDSDLSKKSTEVIKLRF
jgi:hypothetical protein